MVKLRLLPVFFLAFFFLALLGVFAQTSTPPPSEYVYDLFVSKTPFYAGEIVGFWTTLKYSDGHEEKVLSSWELITPAAGRFLDHTGSPQSEIAFQAADVDGERMEIKATCKDPLCPVDGEGTATYRSIIYKPLSPPPSSAGSSPTLVDYCEGDLIAGDDPTYSCAKNALGVDFAYFNNLANAFSCKNDLFWYSLAVRAGHACRPFASWIDAVMSCFAGKVGGERYQALSSGAAKVTSSEREIFNACFSNPQYLVSYTPPSAPLPDEKTSCLIEAWGEARYTAIAEGAVPTLEEEEKARSCFRAPPVEEAPPAVFELPAEVEACLLEAFGQERFGELRSGRFAPTLEEIEKGLACFEEIHPIEGAVLPPPPEKVPLLPRSEKLKVEVIKTEYVENEPHQIVLSGKALPNTVVSIYIFSDPLVLSAKTDANGVWTYYLRNPLDPGDHTAYVVARTEGGEEVRSDLFNFRVAAAAPGEGSLLVEEALPSALSQYLVVAAALVAIALFFVMGIFWLKAKRPPAPPIPPVVPPPAIPPTS